MSFRFRHCTLLLLPVLGLAALPPFLEKNCMDCHDAETRKGRLDLTALTSDLKDPRTFETWVRIHDRIASGEMPPQKVKTRPSPAAVREYLGGLSASLGDAYADHVAAEGRAVRRRLNRFEYENTLRDLLKAPWLDVKEALPEDTEAFRFNKSGQALDVSYVQLSRYIATAEDALKTALRSSAEKPAMPKKRYYAREQGSYTGPMKFSVFNMAPERATFPVLGTQAQPDVRAGNAPLTVGKKDQAARDLEGVGVVASAYEPIEPRFATFRAPVAGRYRLKLCGLTVWVGPGKDPKKWFIPNLDEVSKGRRSEPVTVYAHTTPRVLRRVGNIDLGPEASVQELEVDFKAGESVQVDAVRFFRSRPGAGRFQNPLAEKDGQPGLVMRWIEVEGPVAESWPTPTYRVMFDELPVRKSAGTLGYEVIPGDPVADSERLLRRFVRQAVRHPLSAEDEVRFLPVIRNAMKTGSSFTEAMIAGYTAVLSSPGFLYLEEKPGRLDDHALASRLSYFLWNSPPDGKLRELAADGRLRDLEVLRGEVDRLLADARAARFVENFTDYWLDLRKADGTSPDANLYPDYYLDDHLIESSVDETQAYFTELLRGNLPVRNVVESDFAFVNERLAKLYDLPAFEGALLRKVSLPKDSVRGGLLTQASVLKVTANGTTTSPVVRGAWMMERIVGRKPPPPPPSVPAVEPDIRGATTIRQQLDKHRKLESCASCHTKIDPPGFALESFDVMGGFRTAYRAIDGKKADPGIAKSGQKFAFYHALPVEAYGEFDGRKFKDIREFKHLLVRDERQLARNLLGQFTVYATGSPVGFGDRPKIEAILDATAGSHHGVRDLLRGLVTSDLFLNK